MSFSTLDFNDPDFWSRVKVATSGANIGKFKTSGGVRFVTLRDTAKMVPIVRTGEELWETTVRNAYGSKSYSVIINAQLYDVSKSGLMDALLGSDPVPAGATTPQGRSMMRGKTLAGVSAKQMFYIAYRDKACPSYSFGFGAAPMNTTSAVGGGGPIIVNGRPYAGKNHYDPSAPNGAPVSGEPGPPTIST